MADVFWPRCVEHVCSPLEPGHICFAVFFAPLLFVFPPSSSGHKWVQAGVWLVRRWMFQNIPERTLIPLRQKCVLLFFPPYFVSSRACLLCHVETPSTCFSWLLQYTSLPLSRLTIIGYNVFFMCGGLLKMFKCKSITQKAQSRRFPRGAGVLKREF